MSIDLITHLKNTVTKYIDAPAPTAILVGVHDLAIICEIIDTLKDGLEKYVGCNGSKHDAPCCDGSVSADYAMMRYHHLVERR